MKIITAFLLILLFSLHGWADEWAVIESDHFLVRYTESLNSAKDIQDIAEKFYDQVTADLGFSTARKIDIWFCESRKEFNRANNAPIQDWAAGAAYPLQARIVLLDPSFSENKRIDLDHLVKHEITHVIFGLYLGDNLRNVPRWFNEGIAMYTADDWSYGHYWTILTATIGNSLLPLYNISDEFPMRAYQARVAYAESYSIIDFIAKRYGNEALKGCIKELAKGRPFDEALASSTGANIDWIESLWLKQLKKHYRWYSIISSFSVLWGGAVLILAIAFIRRKMRNRRIVREWEEEDLYGSYNWTGYEDEIEDVQNNYEDDELDEGSKKE
jgi:hypothetical protein